MKYPQLVSSKARFQISDWLIKRLIEFEIEGPEVHARHLLSLLHTPLKIHALDLEVSRKLTVILVSFLYSFSRFSSVLVGSESSEWVRKEKMQYENNIHLSFVDCIEFFLKQKIIIS